MAYDFELLRVRVEAGVATATIANPPINLITLPLFGELLGFAREAAADDTVRVLVLRSDDPDFWLAHFDVQALLGFPTDGPAALGQKVWRGGIAAKGVAACSGCHGPDGAGIAGLYPRLSGQFPEYVEAQLKLFRAGARTNDPNGMMRGVAARMSDAEIRAVAEYAAGLR